jgi:protein required for attachment to host cells
MRRIRVVVADQSVARFFDAFEHGLGLRNVGTLVDADGRKREHELLSDRPGSGVTSGHGHYALQPHASHKEHELGLFAKQIAGRLAAAFHAGEFDDIALVAAPRFLGALRKALPAALHHKVRHEIHHDLVHQSEAVIRTHLPERWAEAGPDV